jgi:sterol desaturase/sphingolipid hydroxylase (fatty acid hydroxylase superfamily)
MEWIGYILSFLIGPLVVEVVGYFWHRYVEHKCKLGTLLATRHYEHHEVFYPVEKLRGHDTYMDAKSWTWYAVGVVTSAIVLLTLPHSSALFVLLGAWAYAWGLTLHMHTAFHVRKHCLWRFKWFRRIARLHDIHHYDNCNYGICLFFMDRIFGTYKDQFPTNHEKQDVFYGKDFKVNG